MFAYLLIVFLSFIGMEFVAWFSHKYIMHGFMWMVHKDHHQKSSGWNERNDLFFLLFAIPSWLGIMLGSIYHAYHFVAIGAGIALYGLCYFLIHDVFIHGRFFKLPFSKLEFLDRIKRGHHKHHSQLNKRDASHFGLLVELFRNRDKKQGN